MEKLRPSDPKKHVDVYCDSFPRPGPNPADHSWWMSAGGAQSENVLNAMHAR